MNAKLDQVKAALATAIEHAEALAKDELAHCPAALALCARLGNAAEMHAALEKQAATLPAPSPK